MWDLFRWIPREGHTPDMMGVTILFVEIAAVAVIYVGLAMLVSDLRERIKRHRS